MSVPDVKLFQKHVMYTKLDIYYTMLFMSVDILLVCGIRLHDRIISLRGEVWAHKTRLTLSPFIEMPVPGQERERHVYV